MKYVRSIWIVIPLSFLASSCQKSLGNYSLPLASGIYAETTNAYPAVVKVILPGGRGLCSGTFISPRAVLTATHCIEGQGSYLIQASFGTFSTTTVRTFGSGNVNDPNDIALLILGRAVASPALGQVASLYDQAREGDTVRLVGFGCTDSYTRSGSGVKRTATNRIYRRDNYLQLLTPLTRASSLHARGILGDSTQGGACFGDSGGPMAIEGVEGNLRLVGTSHAGGQDGNGNAISQYADLTRSDNRNFLNQVNQEFGLGIQGI